MIESERLYLSPPILDDFEATGHMFAEPGGARCSTEPSLTDCDA